MLKVLIVEDDFIIADLVGECLTAAGYAVCGIASTVSNATQLGTLHNPDLGVFDLRLRAGECGKDVATVLRQRSKIGVLYATADNSHRLLRRADEEGCIVLTDAGFDTIEAATADAALPLLEIEPVRLIVTDINLGGSLDGIALAKRARDRTPDIPVLFVSGRPNKLNEARVVGHPVAFLPKPFRLDQLVSNVQRLVDV